MKYSRADLLADMNIKSNHTLTEGSRHLKEGNDTGQDEPRGKSQATTFQVAKIQTEDTLPTGWKNHRTS